VLYDISAGAKHGTGANILDTEVKLNHQYIVTRWEPHFPIFEVTMQLMSVEQRPAKLPDALPDNALSFSRHGLAAVMARFGSECLLKRFTLLPVQSQVQTLKTV